MFWNAIIRRCSSRWALYVLLSVLLAYAVCGVLGWYIHDELFINRDAVWIGFYTSWVQDVIFFSIVGFAVFLHSIPYLADNATFDERVIAFYGNNAPRALRDYAKKEFIRYGGYTKKAKRRIVIFEYDEERKAFRIEYETSQEVANLFDVHYEDKPVNRIIPTTKLDNPPDPFGLISYVNVGGRNVIPDGHSRNIPSDGNPWEMQITLSIPPHGSTSFESRYWVWSHETEPHVYTPNRVVAEFELTIQNTMSDKKVIVKLGEKGTKRVELKPGEIAALETETDVTPHNKIFRFLLECEKV